jgi:lipoprotein LprG
MPMISLHSQTNFTKLPALLATATLAAALVAGCGSESTTAESSSSSSAASTSSASSSASSSSASTSAAPTPDAAGALQESAKTTQTLRAVHIDLEATDLPNLPVGMVNADVTSIEQGNGQAVGNATFRLTPGAELVPTDFLVTQKVFYTKAADGKYESKGPAEKIYDPAIILDKDKGLAKLVGSVTDPKDGGKEDVDGVATVKVSGMIDAAIVDPIVPSMGQGGGQLPITLWIADVPPPAGPPPTTLPSEAPSDGKGPNLVRVVIEKDAGSVDVTLSKWAVPVTIPSP